MTKTTKKNNDIKINEKLDDLIYYNIVFYYHNEPIELMTYYLNNLQFLFNNMIKTNKIQIQICVNFFVSNIDKFIDLLKQKKYIQTTNNYIKYKHIIYENKTNYIETEYIDIKPTNYDFEIRIHEIISKPLKNMTKYNSNNICKYNDDEFIFTSQKINELNVNDGSKSIGFKRYASNIMSWNIYEKIKNKNDNYKNFNQVKVFLFQIDYGTIIGIHIFLHSSIDKLVYNNVNYNLNDIKSFSDLSKQIYNKKDNKKNKNKNDKNNKNINMIGNLSYWFEIKQFLLSKKFITNTYSIDIVKNNETLYSVYDFFYFVLTHLQTVINNFNIVHFTTLGIKNINKPITTNYNNNNIEINSFPYKPNAYEFNKLFKQHYDKFYITDIRLTYLYQNDISKPITYSKNYTSFSEDLLYSSLLFQLKKLIIPHPFLNTTKCSYKHKPLINNNNTINELIYIFLPQDDVGNYKIFDIINYTNNKKHKVDLTFQTDEIDKFIENVKIKYVVNDNIYDDILQNNKLNYGLINNDLIKCNIQNMTNTLIYINKYKNSKFIFDEYNKFISNVNKISKFNKLIDNKKFTPIEYNNLIVIFNSTTNINNYTKIISEANKTNLINYYNDKYNFYNINYKINKSVKTNSDDNVSKIFLQITQHLYNYLIDDLWIIKHIKMTDDKYDYIELKDIKNKYMYEETNYQSKYLKYKEKYISLKKSLQ